MSAEHQQVAQTTLHTTVQNAAASGQPRQARLDHLFREHPGKDGGGANANGALRQHIEQYRAQDRLTAAQPEMAP
jgi:hypothetical protein